jgi:alpha-beta hydrolase superfamily lysophospholipase
MVGTVCPVLCTLQQWRTTLLWPMSPACVASTFARANAMSAAVKNMVEQPACVLVSPWYAAYFSSAGLAVVTAVPLATVAISSHAANTRSTECQPIASHCHIATSLFTSTFTFVHSPRTRAMPCGQVPTLHAPSGRTQVTDVEIPRDALVLITQLGHGEFGDVYRSVTHTPSVSTSSVCCSCKSNRTLMAIYAVG